MLSLHAKDSDEQLKTEIAGNFLLGYFRFMLFIFGQLKHEGVCWEGKDLKAIMES